TGPSGSPVAGIAPLTGVAVPVSRDQWPLASVGTVYVTGLPPVGVTVTVTVPDGSPVPTSTGCGLAVTPSVNELPVSLVVSCWRSIEAAGGVESTTMLLVAVVVT